LKLYTQVSLVCAGESIAVVTQNAKTMQPIFGRLSFPTCPAVRPRPDAKVNSPLGKVVTARIDLRIEFFIFGYLAAVEYITLFASRTV
jgi:hypothetical protein